MAQPFVLGPEDAVTALLAAELASSPGTGEGGVMVFRPRLAPGGAVPDLAEAAASLDICAARRPSRLVLLSSSAALDPSHHNPGFATETYRSDGSNPIARAWRELEALAAAKLPEAVERIVLRPAPVAIRDGGDFIARRLAGTSAIVPPGFDPSLQILAPADLAAAVRCAVERGAGRPGLFHVAPRGTVSLRTALRLAGVRRVPLGWTGVGGEQDYLRHNWTVSGARIERELGFVPKTTSAEAVLAAFGEPGQSAPE
ncbi:MAG TPA: hypothetical protein VGQ28_05655, partial [Thermoanaerobaculia bacterium]|nr:hypothetical protein [Thermoanaerobaculia bacterium]